MLQLVLLSLIVIGCSSKVDTELQPLRQVNGDGFTYSEYFKAVDRLDERTAGIYYEPVSFTTLEAVLPSSFKAAIYPDQAQLLPFEVNKEEAYLVTSVDEQGDVQHQVQYAYLNQSSYGQTEQFFIVSVTEVKENPLAKYDFAIEEYDTVGNELRTELLSEDIPLYHQVVTTNSGLVYRYYSSNEDEINIVATRANELYTYYNGFVYHVGYHVDSSSPELEEEMVNLTRSIILGEGK